MPSESNEPLFDCLVMPFVWIWQRCTGGYRSTRWRERMIVRRIDRAQ
jgi:hypothetical protein